MLLLPNILSCAIDAPLVKAVDSLGAACVSGLKKHYHSLYAHSYDSQENTDHDEGSFSQRKKKYIGDQLLKIYKHGPGILKALKPSSLFDETLEQEKRRRGLWVYLHLLRMMFVLHSTFLVTLELDEFGAKFVGDLYILVLFFFQFSTSITTISSWKGYTIPNGLLQDVVQNKPCPCFVDWLLR